MDYRSRAAGINMHATGDKQVCKIIDVSLLCSIFIDFVDAAG
jgi:hypothetical protein